jgi:hypothetical protein
MRNTNHCSLPFTANPTGVPGIEPGCELSSAWADADTLERSGKVLAVNVVESSPPLELYSDRLVLSDASRRTFREAAPGRRSALAALSEG